MPRPVPASRFHGPHQPTLSQALAAAGYTLAGKRLLSHRGAPVGHDTVGEAADAALARLAAGVGAALAA